MLAPSSVATADPPTLQPAANPPPTHPPGLADLQRVARQKDSEDERQLVRVRVRVADLGGVEEVEPAQRPLAEELDGLRALLRLPRPRHPGVLARRGEGAELLVLFRQ